MSTERQIREEATILFYEQGYHATSMREIAAAVGIKAGSLYNHFSGKQEILYTIALESIQTLLNGARDALDGLEHPEEQLRTLIRWHVYYHAKHRFAAKVADDQLHALELGPRAKVVAVRDEYEEIWKSILHEGAGRGDWNLSDRSIVAFGIATMCTAVAIWYRDDGRLSPDEIADIYADLALQGLKQPPAG
jgi:AcrR family transcriptional regulator